MILPKFCVGEEVAIDSKIAPEYNTDRTEVIYAEYREAHQGSLGIAGWKYKTAHQPDKTKEFLESSLRKIKPDESVSFKELLNELNIPFTEKQE